MIQHVQEAHDAYRAVGDELGGARALSSISWSHARLGEFRTTIARCEVALALHVKLDYPLGAAVTWEKPGVHPPPPR